MDESGDKPTQTDKDGSVQADVTNNKGRNPDRNKIYREKRKQIKCLFQHYAVEVDEKVDDLYTDISYWKGKAPWRSDGDQSGVSTNKRKFVSDANLTSLSLESELKITHGLVKRKNVKLSKVEKDNLKKEKKERERLRHKRDRELMDDYVANLCNYVVEGEAMIAYLTKERDYCKAIASTYYWNYNGNSSVLPAAVNNFTGEDDAESSQSLIVISDVDGEPMSVDDIIN